MFKNLIKKLKTIEEKRQNSWLAKHRVEVYEFLAGFCSVVIIGTYRSGLYDFTIMFFIVTVFMILRAVRHNKIRANIELEEIKVKCEEVV